MTSEDEVSLTLGELRMRYGYTAEGEIAIITDWTIQDTDKVTDMIVRGGMIAHLQNLEADLVFSEDDD